MTIWLSLSLSLTRIIIVYRCLMGTRKHEMIMFQNVLSSSFVITTALGSYITLSQLAVVSAAGAAGERRIRLAG